jgi:RNA polymerase sigma factor (sigma-70 family)
MSDWIPDVKRLRAFDDAEWQSVERHFCGRLYAYAARRIRDRDAREDVVLETFLGAVRGIDQYDPAYTFEQYLFGICKNRTIDWLRRNKVATLQSGGEGDDEATPIEELARESDTPSRIVRQHDLEESGVRALQDYLRAWVQEAWQQSEFTRLMVVEALFVGRWRNRDTWERFDLRDETAVAGIKFRALKRLREIAMERDTKKTVLPLLAAAVDSGEGLAIDVGDAWTAGRVSCPARHWYARLVSGSLPEGPRAFLRFHVDEMRCAWCRANLDDLESRDSEADLEAMVARVSASTVQYLRSRTHERGR